MPFNQWCQVVEESSYGVPQAVAPVVWWPRLHADDGFQAVPTPQYHEILSADSHGEPIQNISNSTAIAGRLTTLVYPEYVAGLLAWATDIATGDLPSKSVRHFDGVQSREYNGGKVKKLTLAMQQGQMQGMMLATLDLAFQKVTENPAGFSTEPSSAVFPTKSPYSLKDTSGGLVLRGGGSSTRAKYNALSITFENTLVGSFDEGLYISDLLFYGRKVTGSVSARFETTTDRLAFEAGTLQTMTADFNRVTPDRLLLDLKARVLIAQYQPRRPLFGPSYDDLTLTAMRSGGSCFSYTLS